jgi:glycosyltransferase involved in cell wall biosynthesis
MTRENSLVSVIIPSYNSARTLRLCLRSVADQTYAPIEVVVVDDRSTDDSAQIAKSMDAIVLCTEVNSGQSVARNLGADHARGPILFFLDSDVALSADGIEIAVAALQADPAIGAICGVYDAAPLLSTSLAAQYRTAQQYVWFNEVEGAIPGLHTALFAIRADVFKEIGPFNPELRHTEDQEYGYRLGRKYDVRVSLAIRGRHDHDATLRTILYKVFHRTRLGIPLWFQNKALPGGAATGPRALASAFTLAAALTLPLPWVIGAIGVVVPLLLTAITIGLDTATYRYVLARRGIAFGLYFIGVHLLVILTSAIAAGIGVLQHLLGHWAGGRRRASATAAPPGHHAPRG